MPDLFEAIRLHQAGKLDQAARLYQELLAHNPEDADALHLLGVVRHQRGDHAGAVQAIRQAIALRPSVPAFHANLAEAYRALGQFTRAEGSCRMALQLSPDYPEALSNLGLALWGQKRATEAAQQFRRALELRPTFAAAHNNLGLVLRDLGDLETALQHFQTAVELDPGFAAARTNLSQMVLARGRAEEALGHCQEAVRLQPDRAALHHNLGNALRALGRNLEARVAYLEALRLEPDLAQANASLGLLLCQEGKLDDAVPWLQRAVELDPDNAVFQQSLAEFYEEWEEPGLAIPCWERVLSLHPDRADAHLSLGWALQDEGRLEEAETHYRRAMEIQPGLAAAPFNLGGLHEELGRMAEAEDCFREALRLQPDYALPHVRLATLLRGKLSDADFEALSKRVTDPDLAPGFRARLLFGLAQVLDGRGDHARAADCLRRANAQSKELARGRRDYFPAEHEKLVDDLLQIFTPELFRRTAGMGLDTRRPVFIFGLPRSGTTLTEQILASHPQVFGAGELRFARQTFEAVPATLGVRDASRQCIADLTPAAIRNLAEEHLRRLEALSLRDQPGGSSAERIADKMPDNYLYLGLLAILFPRATFIHCRRDLRDVAVSCWMTDFRSIRWANDQEHLAHRFRQYDRLMRHWEAVLPVPVERVDYEETVADVEAVARRLVAACGLDWDPACLAFHTLQRPVRTASVTQVRQPIYQRSLARWKHYEAELADLFAALPSSVAPDL